MSFLLKLLTDKFWLDQEVLYDYKTDLRVISPHIKVMSRIQKPLRPASVLSMMMMLMRMDRSGPNVAIPATAYYDRNVLDEIWGCVYGLGVHQKVEKTPTSDFQRGVKISNCVVAFLLVDCSGVSGFYRAMLCTRLNSHGPVSARPSVCPCLSQVGVLSKRLNESSCFFSHVSFLPPVLHCVKRKFGYLQK